MLIKPKKLQYAICHECVAYALPFLIKAGSAFATGLTIAFRIG